MDIQERLMNGVIDGDLSVIDDLLAEKANVSDNNMEALRAAEVKLNEAKIKTLYAESIVEMLKIGCAANEVIPNTSPTYVDFSLCKFVDSMAEGNEKARKILFDILKSQERNNSYIFELDRMGIRGDDIVAIYEFSGKSILKLFYFLDHESDKKKLISYLAKFNSTGEKE